VYLHADQAVKLPVRRIVIDGDAHQTAVEDMCRRVAAHDLEAMMKKGESQSMGSSEHTSFVPAARAVANG
jgi:hypothetical protein